MVFVVAGLVGTTIAAITALFYVTVLQQPPPPTVMGIMGVASAVIAGWRWWAAGQQAP